MITLKKHFSNLAGYLAIALITLIMFSSIYLLGGFNGLERVIGDAKFQAFQRSYDRDDIVMIAIDQNSIEQFSERFRLYWPWPRELHSRLLDFLVADGAKVVTFDFLFDQPDFDRIDTNAELSDQRFANSIRNSERTVLATLTSSHSGLSKTERIKQFTLIPENQPALPPEYLSNLPYDPFLEGLSGIGNATLAITDDAVVRRVPLLTQLQDGNWIPSLSLATLLQTFESTPEIAFSQNHLSLGDRKIPIDENGNYLVNWYDRGGTTDGTFTYYSYYAIFQTAIAFFQGREDRMLLPPGTFQDKIVLIGASAAGLSDIKATPISIFEPVPGMEVHATAIANFLDEIYLKQPSKFWTLLIVTLLIFLTSGFVILLTYRNGLIMAFGVLILSTLFSLFLFAEFRILLPTGFFFISIAGTISLTGLYKYMTVEKNKKMIKSAFNQYVQKELVDEIIEKPELLKLGGQKREMSVMFSDLAGFTAISERLTPEELVEFLNEYLTAMTDIIFKYKGTLDKYIGDAIMAFWGAPLHQPDHAKLACSSVIAMIRETDRLRDIWISEGKPKVHVRYGINTGPMVVGNMGSLERFNYTVMGDSVNLGARLEPANNMFSTTAMISQYTYEHVKDDFFCRKLDLMAVKGKNEPVYVYELIAENRESEMIEAYKEIVSDFEKGLEAYYNQDWDKALSFFRKHPDDGPSKTYIDRTENFKNNPPGDSWDGVYRMTTK